ncbi:TPA: hypothetical protein SIA27_004042 [Aeromonas salmonicida]|nr:hypothetical protein [Aeromonas salmonicida]
MTEEVMNEQIEHLTYELVQIERTAKAQAKEIEVLTLERSALIYELSRVRAEINGTSPKDEYIYLTGEAGDLYRLAGELEERIEMARNGGLYI